MAQQTTDACASQARFSPASPGLRGAAVSARGQELCRAYGAGAGHLSLSDEAGLIVAVAILMKA